MKRLLHTASRVLFLLLVIVFVSLPVNGEAFSGDIHTKSVLLMDPSTDSVLFDRNGGETRICASLTKIMTYIVAAEQCGDLENTMVTVTQSAIDAVRSTGAAMAGFQNRIGESYSVLDLLRGMMIPSGCDAAEILARHFGGGDPAAFVRLMNEKATALGCANTVFVDAHGLSRNNVSTAYDLYKITKYALTLPYFSQIVSTVSCTLPGMSNTLINTNYLLHKSVTSRYYYPYAVGVKTGYLQSAGNCLITLAEKNGKQLLTVALGGSVSAPGGTNYAMLDTVSVLEWGFLQYLDTVGVKLDAESKTMLVGQTAALRAEITANNTGQDPILSWSTSAPTVATVDDHGNVTAVKPGTATITVTTQTGDRAQCRITVRTEAANAGAARKAASFDLCNGEAVLTQKPGKVENWNGFRFGGWYTRKNGGEQITDADGDVLNGKNLADGITYYAHWISEQGKTVYLGELELSQQQSVDAAEEYGYRWDAETKTLYLNGFTLLSGGKSIGVSDEDGHDTVSAVYCDSSATVCAEGTNTIRFVCAEAEKTGCALYVGGDMAVEGKGTLRVDALESRCGRVSGIVTLGSITNSGDLTSLVGDGEEWCIAISCGGQLENSGSVTAKAGSAPQSYGLYLGGNLTARGDGKLFLEAEKFSLYGEKKDAALSLQDSAETHAVGDIRAGGTISASGTSVITVYGDVSGILAENGELDISGAVESQTGNETRLSRSDANIPIRIVPHVHQIEQMHGKETTIAEKGWQDCYFCESCGKFFEDEAAKKPIDNLEQWRADHPAALETQELLIEVIPLLLAVTLAVTACFLCVRENNHPE